MIRNLSRLLLATLMLASCKHSVTTPEVKTLEAGAGFDLEKVHFDENVPLLYSKHLLNENDIAYDSVRDGKMNDTLLRYRISNIVTESMHFTVPAKEFGYLYRSPEKDSLARFGNTYFNTLYTLTDLHKKPVAYYAGTRFDSVSRRSRCLDSLRKKYGPPKYAFLLDHEFNQCSYEWDLKDRTLQVETSFGFEASASSDGTGKSGKYYLLDLLLIDNRQLEAIYQAHIFEMPDKILYDGKWQSYKAFQFDKVTRFSDVFSLNSKREDLIHDEWGEHNIERAEQDE